MVDRAQLPVPEHGLVLTHFLTVRDVAVSRQFYADVFGGQVVLEEFLEGPEISFFALCDGKRAVTLGVAQDHKRIGEGNTGPNTGGMGAYSTETLISRKT